MALTIPGFGGGELTLDQGLSNGLTNGGVDNAVEGLLTPWNSAGGSATDRRVRIRSRNKNFNQLLANTCKEVAKVGLIWPYTPQVTVAQSIEYQNMDPVHSNQGFLAYAGTKGVTINIAGEFTVQNKVEWDYALQAIHFVRSASKMSFGENSRDPGTPPPTLLLDAYGPGIFKDFPVIMTNYDIGLPQDVSYVTFEHNKQGTWLPAHFTLGVSLVEQHTPNELRKSFVYEDYVSGNYLKKGGWW